MILSGKDREDCAQNGDIVFLFIRTASGVLPDHRSVLGSILGLGLERDVVGDIFQVRDGMAAAVKEKTAPFIRDQLQRVGRESVKVEMLTLPPDFTIEQKTEEIKINISSLRLDCVLSAILKISREDAAAYIKSGMAQIDHRVILQPDRKVPENGLLSLCGKGRYIVTEEQHRTKSGRLFLTVRHYI